MTVGEKSNEDLAYSSHDKQIVTNVLYNSVDPNNRSLAASKLVDSDQNDKRTDQNSSEINAQNAAGFIDGIQLNIGQGSQFANQNMQQ